MITIIPIDRFSDNAHFHGFEPPGRRKSDFWSKNDSFWWGARLRTSKMQLFHYNKSVFNKRL